MKLWNYQSIGDKANLLKNENKVTYTWFSYFLKKFITEIIQKKKKCFIIFKNGIKSGIVISLRFKLLYARPLQGLDIRRCYHSVIHQLLQTI